MQTPRAYWSQWADLLNRWKLDHFAAWLLDAGGPLTLLGAQVLYIGQPFFKNGHVLALAEMLDDDIETKAFAYFLREGKAP
jgi:hypothetical protein